MPPALRSFFRRCLCLLAWVAGLGVSTLQGQTVGFRHFDHRDGLPQSQVTALLEDRSGFIWVGTMDALARLGPSGFKSYGALQGLKARQVLALLEDSRGSIWVASPDQGVAEIRGNQVRSYGPEEGLKVQEIFSLAETPAGELLAGTRLGLFRKKGSGPFEQVPLQGAWAFSPIFTLAKDGEGHIWMASRRGMVGQLEGTTVKAVPLPPHLSQEPVMTLQTDPRGRLWAVLRTALLRLEGGQWVVEPLPGLQGPLRLGQISFAPSGEMILPLGPDGLYLKPVNGPSRHLTYLDGLPRDSIFTAIRDRHGALWVGSNGGGLSMQPSPGLMTLDLDPATGLSLSTTWGCSSSGSTRTRSEAGDSALPAPRVVLTDSQLIQHPGGEGVEEFLDGFRPVVEARHERHHDGACIVDPEHVLEVDAVEGRLPQAEHQGAALLEADIRRPGD